MTSPNRELSRAEDISIKVVDESISSVSDNGQKTHARRISEIPISTTDHDLLSSVDRTKTQRPLPQLDVLAGATATTAAMSSSSLPRGVEESDDGFRTPTRLIIPLTILCPPAPRKPKYEKRIITSLLREEGLYNGTYYRQVDLAIEIDVWLNFLEERDRRRIKKAQHEAGKATLS